MMFRLMLQSSGVSTANPVVPSNSEIIWGLVSMGLLMVVPMALIIVALYDLLDYAPTVWGQSGLGRTKWILITVTIPIVGPLVYLVAARPKLMACCGTSERL